ncbi:MAG: glycosyltransferase [Phycisphaerae bacterium]
MTVAGATLAIVVKGYPRLSETFIARELAGLQRRGIAFSLHALRHPSADARLTRYEPRLACDYLPEYLHEAPLVVARAVAGATGLPGFAKAARAFRHDLARDPGRARIRRFGQACVLAQRLGRHVHHIHCHFAHSPASVARYAACLLGIGYSLSAHAKDVWTTPVWDLRDKLAEAAFVVTCNSPARDRLLQISPDCRLSLVHHGVDGGLVVPSVSVSTRDGSDAGAPVRLVAVARAVEKKGLRHLLEAVARLAGRVHVELAHFGDGPLLGRMREHVVSLGLQERVTLHGGRPHGEIIAAMDAADLLVFPADVAADGDRDGLPNVVLEAQARGLCVVACDAGGVGDAVRDGVTGALVARGDPEALACRIEVLCRQPQERARLARAALGMNAALFDAAAGHDQIAALLREAAGVA